MNASHRKFLLYDLSYRKYTEGDLFPVAWFDGRLSKRRSPFASEDVLIDPSTFTSVKSQDVLNGNQCFE